MKYLLITLLSLLTLELASIENLTEIPVLYQGRFRPFKAYAALTLSDLAHTSKIASKSTEDLLFEIHFKQESSAAIIAIPYLPLKKALKLEGRLFSYSEVYKALYETKDTALPILTHLIGNAYAEQKNESAELKQLAANLRVEKVGQNLILLSAPKTPPWHFLTPGMVIKQPADTRLAIEALELLRRLNRFANLKMATQESHLEQFIKDLGIQGYTAEEIGYQVEEKFPLQKRLADTGEEFLMLPMKTVKGRWVSLSALGLKEFNIGVQRLVPISNFTSYPDLLFNNLQKAYLDQDIESLKHYLKEGYATLANVPYVGSLNYPSVSRLKAEAFYYSFPLLELALLLYIVAIILLLLRKKTGFYFLAIACLIHTILLALRCFILQRPPVSNMFETILYVPWVGVVSSFVFFKVLKNPLISISSTASAIILLGIIYMGWVDQGLENVQAVLDSHYWLIIHVLMIVGSYGLFILCGILGHLYLAGCALQKHDWSKKFENLILQSMYAGTALLIPGTLLGGVWAAQSWGRFWDWDPKESWAFISSCIYVLWIHLYRFRHISGFGLAIGSLIGMQAIIFTWYGVNYILGTGLHSYGFGNGGNGYYYAFLGIEFLYLGLATSTYKYQIHPYR